MLVDCDTGYGRTGVQTPQAASELALYAAAAAGSSCARAGDVPDRRRRAARGSARHASRIQAAGLDVDWVSGGGTPTARSTHEIGVVTEVRAGTYVYGDRACAADGSVPVDECALHVVATVVSRPDARARDRRRR